MSRAGRLGGEIQRDQAPSTFTRILQQLVERTPGAFATALVDFEGETVDYAGRLDPFELKVAAAHWQLVLAQEESAAAFGAIRQLTVRAQSRSYFVRRLHENYALVIVLHPRAAFSVSERAIVEAVAGLSLEAGWPLPRNAARWFGVQVEAERSDQRRRPVRIRVAGTWQTLEIMGSVMGLRPRERGFRVRLASGAEIMLIRERLGFWFLDEPV